MSAAIGSSVTVRSRHADAPVGVRVVNGVNPITTPAFEPAGAGPWICAKIGVPVRFPYDRSQQTSGGVAPRSNVTAAVPKPSGSAGGTSFAPLNCATSGVCVAWAPGWLLRALPKAMVGTAIAAASPTAVKANSLLFCIGSLSLDTKNSHWGCPGQSLPKGGPGQTVGTYARPRCRCVVRATRGDTSGRRTTARTTLLA